MDWQITIEPVKGKSSDAASDLPESRTFPPGVEQIVFGRESTCDVVFPPGARMVGGMHGRLYRQPSGHYAIQAYGDHYFELNGYRAERDQNVADNATIRFGGPKGPAVRVRLVRGPRKDGLLSTLTQVSVTPVAKVLAQLGTMQKVLAAALVVAVAAGAWVYWTLPDFDREMAALRETMMARAQADFPATEALRAAAFAVIRRDRDGAESLLGTAWPYRPGMLVTNAHVAVLFDRLRRGESLLVRRPDSGGDHVVTGRRIHPGYQAFNDFAEQARQASIGYRSMTEGVAMPSAYDVAVLEVDAGEDLGPMLAVAADSGPVVLKAGMSLAYAGYPVEGTGAQKSGQISPNPQLQYGAVTSTTDYFLFGTEAAHAYLVQDSLPATGGASGSPIIDRSGRVVAILSGGNITRTATGRAPSAVLINYAQRADLIAGAVEPASFDLDAERQRWTDTLPRFDAHELSIVEGARHALEQATGAAVGDKVETTSLKTGGAVKAGTTQYRDHQVPVEAGHTYDFVVYGERGASLGVALFRGQDGIDGHFGNRWFASLTHIADRDETLTLRVIGEASNPVGYKLHTLRSKTAPGS